MSAFKMYVLLDEYNGTIPLYQRVSQTQRIQLNKRPVDHAFLRVTAWDPKGGKNGKGGNTTIRLKLNSNTIDQNEQIKDEGILANEEFTVQEKKAVEFRNGICISNNEIVQRFLEKSPQFEGSELVSSDPIVKKLYKLVDKKADAKIANEETRKRVKAAAKIMDMDDQEAKETLIRVNGAFFEVPEDLEEKQNYLMDFLDNTNLAGVDKILTDEVSVDEAAVFLVGELEAKGIISFDLVPDFVTMRKGDKDVNLKKITSEMTAEERHRHFIDYILSDSGLLVHEELKAAMEETKEKKSAKNKKADDKEK